MSSTQLADVRSFNRIVTERVGALGDDFLGRKRPLGEARLLWEVARQGADVRDLRARLGLDSGYLSRLLRALEQEGLVSVTPSSRDARVRRVELTPRGAAEWDELESRSEEFAASVLRPLNAGQREALLEAMGTVSRLLTASAIAVRVESPRSADARWCLTRYFEELDARFDGGFVLPHPLGVEAERMAPPHGLFVMARLRDAPVGCGSLRFRGTGPAEIKRMWVSPSVRGLGLGRRLLHELEGRAREAGAPATRLETNRSLREAISLYRDAGYREVKPFNDLPYAHHWFEKSLPHD
ncbi:MAG TPA: MarR family winged helix-turn-helix transcriptional regulator [Gaiellaceae bacterium]|nr:MarR family winged helix-turn-helix transcriptional regulator [Gaiellaceae bacterium]